MLNIVLLKHSIEHLKKIRCELTGKVRDKYICRIDKVIQDLVNIQECNSEVDNLVVLSIIGSVLEFVPAIASIIKMLSEK